MSIIKKVSRAEKIEIGFRYMNAGLKRSKCLKLTGLTRHQLYYKSIGRKVWIKKSGTNLKLKDESGNTKLVQKQEIVKKIIIIKENPDQGN